MSYIGAARHAELAQTLAATAAKAADDATPLQLLASAVDAHSSAVAERAKTMHREG
jgi:hypothetical protein